MRVTWLDRAISQFSPARAIRRVQQRAAFDRLARAYDGASRDRRTASWSEANASADAEIAAAGAVLRARSRDLVRNNPHARRAVSAWTVNLVGDGIEPRVSDVRVAEAWKAWAKRCDADGQLDFNGIQSLSVHEMVEAGEVLIRRRWRRKTDRVPGSMQIQVLEADHIDTEKNQQTQDGVIINGIEFDGKGTRVAYWLFPEHPGAGSTLQKTSLVSRRVLASEVIHLYRKTRTQVRGVPWGSAVISTLRGLGEYEAAELMRKRIEACVVGVVVGSDEVDPGLGIPLEKDDQAPGVYDAQGVQIDRFEPGMFAVARGGKDIKFNAPASTGSYEGYRRASLHTVASGFDLPYAVLTGDLSAVNYSSIRAGLIEFRRHVQSLQWQLIIPTLCERVFAWFLEAHRLTGELPEGSDASGLTWAPPKFVWVDPLKDATADLLAMRAGIRTWDEVVAEQGRDPEEVLAEIAARNKKFDDAGIILDSDPRHTAKNGALQVVVNAGDDPQGKDGDAPRA